MTQVMALNRSDMKPLAKLIPPRRPTGQGLGMRM
jgi:hypothetical protein